MSDLLFIDTAYLFGLIRRGDEMSERARAWRDYIRRHQRRLVTTEAVLWEMLDSLASPRQRTLAHRLYQELHADDEVQIVSFDASQMNAAIDLYGLRSDKEWGVTDCLSFNVMQRLGISEALTSDHHFEQAGYTALLRHDPPGS